MSHSIKILTQNIIDQIKAGEVIERPSTLIKEILENAVDANATKLILRILNNGLDLISLTDNGHGLSFEELPLAFTRHATSKIKNFEDLYSLMSYGFRGEALPSIASVSKVTCKSTKNGETSEISICGGEMTSHLNLGNLGKEDGTILEIKDLFYNTPVRLKFLQSEISERNHIKKIIKSFLLAFPNIDFQIKYDDQETEIYSANAHQVRIKEVLSNESILKFEESYEGIIIEGYISKEASRSTKNRNHFIFVNNRYIQDMAIHKILLNSASRLWFEGEVGDYVLFIKIPPNEIDPNVHPNKIVIKFFETSKVQALISGAIKKLLTVKDESSQKENNCKETYHYEPQESPEIKHYWESLVPSSLPSKNIRLSTSYALIGNVKNSYKIVDLNKYLVEEFTETLKTPPQSMPLLISKPFKDPSHIFDPIAKDLMSLGIELDRLDKSIIVIRSLPLFFQKINSSLLFEKLAQKKIAYKKNEDFILELKIQYLSDYLLESPLEFKEELLLKEGVSVILNDQTLKGLFP